MQIHFDDDEQMTNKNEEQSYEENTDEPSEVVKKMVSEIKSNENQNKSENEVEKIDFEIVKIADADGNSEIGIE